MSLSTSPHAATNEYDAVLFDMDGVTVQSAHLWRSLEQHVILPAAVEEASIPYENLRALSVTDAYTRLTEMETLTVTVDRAEFRALYDRYAPFVYLKQASLLPGYHALLDTLKAQGLAVGLVSASPRAWVALVLERFGLTDTYDVVVTMDDIDGPSKPDPTVYRQTAGQLGIAPSRCVVIEDSQHGIEAARAAGMDCIALRGPGNEDRDLSAATVVADSPTALAAQLRTQLTGDPA